MRVTIFLTVLLLVYCLSADAWLFRRRRRSSTTVINNEQRTYTFQLVNNGNLVWSGAVTGTVTKDGKFIIQSGRKRRSVEMNGNRYNVTLQVDPCNFNTYDDDRDGEITPGEFETIFGDSDLARDLFNELDNPKKNGVVGMEEFIEMAPDTITACEDIDDD